MLYQVTDLSDPLVRVVKDDPVRPEIPIDFRVEWPKSAIYVSVDSSGIPTAAICAAFTDSVPSSVDELLSSRVDSGSTVVFYTVWSYCRGAGRSLIYAVRDHISSVRPQVVRYVTLSPQGDSVERFHVRNGAAILRVNADTVNYIYR